MLGLNNFINRWWVVDGEQRITTLQVIIAAAHNVFVKNELNGYVSMLSDLLTNEEESVRAPLDKYKIEHIGSCRDPAILHAGSGGSATPSMSKPSRRGGGWRNLSGGEGIGPLLSIICLGLVMTSGGKGPPPPAAALVWDTPGTPRGSGGASQGPVNEGKENYEERAGSLVWNCNGSYHSPR